MILLTWTIRCIGVKSVCEVSASHYTILSCNAEASHKYVTRVDT